MRVFGHYGYSTLTGLAAARPTTMNSEANVAKAHGSEPWNTGKHSKYQYHPGGDTSVEPKDAPSALNSTIVPNVSLPKVQKSLGGPVRRQEFADA